MHVTKDEYSIATDPRQLDIDAIHAFLSRSFWAEGIGLGKWLIETVMAHRDLQGLRRFQLVTRDAHGLYARHGFTASGSPERHMEIFRHGMYLRRE